MTASTGLPEPAGRQLHAVLESISDACFALDAEWRFTYVNGRAAQIWGRAPATLIGMGILEQFPEFVDSESFRLIGEAARGGTTTRFETRSPVLGRWIEVSVCPGEGGPVVFFHDVSERRRAAQALRQSEERRELLLADSGAGFWECVFTDGSEEPGSTYLSPQLKKLLGFEMNEFPDRLSDWRGRIHPDDVDQFPKGFEELGSGERRLVETEFRIRHKDGRYRWLHSRGVLSRDADGRSLRWSGLDFDVTERRRAAEAVRESEHRFRTLAETLPQLVWTCLPDGSCDYLSRQWCDYTGLPEADQLGSGWLAVLHPEDRDRVRRSWEGTVAGQGPHDIDYRMRAADGTCRWFKSRALPLCDESGNIVRWFGTNTDISAIVEAHAEAARADAAKSRFLAAASHDLRQPLQAARIYLDLLSQRLADPGQAALAGDTRRALMAGENLLNALLDVSTLESGGVQPEFRDIPVQHVLDALLYECRPEAETKGLQLIRVSSRAVVRSDLVLLRRMLRNLLHNAIRYTPRGRVLFGCRRQDGALRIEVWDTGTGIPTDQISAIFEDFHQLENPERNRARGLGLGLSVVQRLARLLGHEISVRSTPRGSGFALTVPLVGETPRPAPARAATAPPGAKPQPPVILVIEDDGIQLMGMEMLLASWGYRVIAAADGEKALAMVKVRGGVPPDLVLSDLRLPGSLTGFEAINRIRDLAGRRIPGIILTGDTDPRRLREAKASDLVLLHKPFDPANLGGVIEGLLEAAPEAAGAAVA